MNSYHPDSKLRILLFLALLLALSVPSATLQAQNTPPSIDPPPVVAMLPAPDQTWQPYLANDTSQVNSADIGSSPSQPDGERQGANTDATTANTISYVRQETLAVVYTNTPGWHMSSAQVDRVKVQLQRLEEFIWRNSHLQLDLGLQIQVIDTYKDESEFHGLRSDCDWLLPNDYDGDGESVDSDLAALGYTAGQFDSIHILWAHGPGLQGSCAGGIIWADWHWPTMGVTELSGNVLLAREDIWNPINWSAQQTIRMMFNDVGYHSYLNPHQPERNPGRFGEGWSYDAFQMRNVPVTTWQELAAKWGTLRNGTDADSDGVIDDQPAVPFDEIRLGSIPTAVDTDADGATDRQEAMAGYFRGSNPMQPDTDGDGVSDSQDFAPLYPVQAQIAYRTQTLGNDPAEWDLLVDHIEYATTPIHAAIYANWDADALYLMIAPDRPVYYMDLRIDATGDGWFHGRDNYQIELNPVSSNPTASGVVRAAQVFDCSEQILNDIGHCMWDNQSGYPYARRITAGEIGRYTRAANGGYLIQIAVPANPKTDFAPTVGLQPGFRLILGTINNSWQQWAHVFEENDMVYPTLAAAGKTILLSSSTGGRVAGIPFRDEDILAYHEASGQWSMYFDGSDVGLTADVNALSVLGDGSLLMSLNAPQQLPGVGWVDDSDIVRFVPTTLGSATSGFFTLFVPGSTLELTTNGEDIDALSLQQPEGELLLSTLGSGRVAGTRIADEDILRYRYAYGYHFDGVRFDGSSYRLTDRSEDIWAIWQTEEALYLSTQGLFAVEGLRGDGSDIFACTPQHNGTCAFTLYWDGLAAGFDGEQIDALAMITAEELPITAAGVALTEELEANDTVDDDIIADETNEDSATQIFLPFIRQE